MVPAGVREPSFADSAEVWHRCPDLAGDAAAEVGAVGVAPAEVVSGAEDAAGGSGAGADEAQPVAHSRAAAVRH